MIFSWGTSSGIYNDSKEFGLIKKPVLLKCVAKLKEIGMTDKLGG